MCHIVPHRLCIPSFEHKTPNVLAQFWLPGSCDEILQKKLKDKEKYDEDLKKVSEEIDTEAVDEAEGNVVEGASVEDEQISDKNDD